MQSTVSNLEAPIGKEIKRSNPIFIKAKLQGHFFDILLFNIYNYNETVITMLTVKTVTKKKKA